MSAASIMEKSMLIASHRSDATTHRGGAGAVGVERVGGEGNVGTKTLEYGDRRDIHLQNTVREKALRATGER